MCLGALVDAGVPLKEIERSLRALPIRGYKLEARKVKRASIAATKVDVVVQESRVKSRKSEAKTWNNIRDVISKSSLPPQTKQKGLNIFRRLFESEGKIRGMAYQRIHLREFRATYCLVDVFGTLIALDFLDVDKVCSSAVNLGSGFVNSGHGRLPVPAPAAAETLRDFPVYSSDIAFELTTPTGAAILRETAGSFVTMPLLQIRSIGYGAGQRETADLPNVLRVFLGEEAAAQNQKDLPKETIIETNIDDMNPQVYGYVMERLFASGALDVFLTQIIMKKGRPGILLTVLCREEQRADIVDILFRETTTIGLRFYEASRAFPTAGRKREGGNPERSG